MKKAEKVLLALAAVLLLAGIWRCPLRYFFGLSCPGCGMTRALLSALKLDFAGAFGAHPLWFLPPAALILLAISAVRHHFHGESVHRGEPARHGEPAHRGEPAHHGKVIRRAAVITAAVFIAVWCVRLALRDPIVMPDIGAGLMWRIFHSAAKTII